MPGFLIGVASSAHCAGMCGAFALRAGTGGPRAPWRMLLYLGGKTFTYVFLGALAGLAGAQAVDLFAGAGPWLGLVVGAVLLLAGVRLLRPPAALSASGTWFARLLAPVFGWAHGAEAAGGPFALGAVTGLLPCGIVFSEKPSLCIECGVCEKVCPVILDPKRLGEELPSLGDEDGATRYGDAECIRCGDCIEGCGMVYATRKGETAPLRWGFVKDRTDPPPPKEPPPREPVPHAAAESAGPAPPAAPATR